MEDNDIITLYFDRSSSAIEETQLKYGRYCSSIAMNILGNPSDAEECLNDALLKAWNAIPPERPANLKAYLGRIARNLALDRYDAAAAQKRGSGNTALVLDELSICVPCRDNSSEELELAEITEAINRFLSSQPEEKRRVFVRRYWYMDSLQDICGRYGLKLSNVKTMLFRMRQELKKSLQKEGLIDG